MINENFDEIYKKNLTNYKLYQGSLITSKVTEINSKFVIVNAFIKSDGYIPISQFKNDDGKLEVDIGSTTEVIVDNLEDFYGDIKLSREKAKRVRTWEKLESIYKKSDIITGYITAKVKGGFTVKLNSVKAFLPGSLISFKSIIGSEEIKKKKLKFKIIKLEKKKNNIVLSQKFILEEEKSKNLDILLRNMKEGDTVSGVVKNITDYGVFIDLGGLDGLLHITDMSWKRIKHPSNLVKISDKINVKILKFDKNTNRISLGLKQLTKDPWKNIKNKYKEGMNVSGKVTNITDYGCFVEIEEGIEGLVHLSEMDWTNKNVNPNKIVKQGMDVKVNILDLNIERRRISLGLKQHKTNPWSLFKKKHKIGDMIYGRIKYITDFGLFLELNKGVDGLVHISDISWENNSDSMLKKYKRNEKVKVIILSIDIERRRIFLGLKQLKNNSFLYYISEKSKGDIINGTITKKLKNELLIKLSDNVNGFLKSPKKNINFKNKIKVQIIDINKKKEKILLSHVNENNYRNKIKEKNEIKSTLGDLLKKEI